MSAIIALAFELLTMSFFFASVSVGLFFAAFGNYLGFTTENQIYIFSIGVIITFFLIKPLFNKFAYSTNQKKTNKDGLINQVGVVSRKVGNELNSGLVKLNGDVWKAITKGEEIKVSSKVRVIEIDSITLTVEEIK